MNRRLFNFLDNLPDTGGGWYPSTAVAEEYLPIFQLELSDIENLAGQGLFTTTEKTESRSGDRNVQQVLISNFDAARWSSNRDVLEKALVD